TTSTNPYGARPAATVATRISRAFVDGTRPPDSPRANRLRQLRAAVPADAAGGTWLWTRQPCRWGAMLAPASATAGAAPAIAAPAIADPAIAAPAIAACRPPNTSPRSDARS